MNKLSPITPGVLHQDVRHDSANKHVAGRAEYIDDLIEPEGLLYAYLGLSQRAHADIDVMNLDAVRAAPGVVGVLTAADVFGENDVSTTHSHDEPVFAENVVEFFGQPMFAVLGETRDAARRATRLAEVAYRERPHVLDCEQAMEAGSKLVCSPMTLERGDVEAGLAAAPRRAKGRVTIGGQDHFYLEGQIAMAIPGEDDDVTIYSSTQHPAEVQLLVSHIMGIPEHAITVIVRRMGGGFGGKETQANLFAVIAAIAAKKFKRPVKIRPDRDDDMVATGKRHDFVVDYEVGYDATGKIGAVQATYAARAGYSSDLSGPVTDRALFHCDNTYWYPAVRVNSQPLKTNTVSNTAFRGFGGPQGIMAAERWIEEIAYDLGVDPLEIRKRNFYGTTTDNVTPYHQEITDNIVRELVDELERTSEYAKRRAAVLEYNRGSPVLKKGIALTPVKFGISFTATWYNQGSALVHVYRDGSVHLSHGGTEMGQGLYTKVAQVLADALGLGLDHIKITETSTAKIPNSSATAASTGADLNGMAALDAARQLKERLHAHAAEMWATPPEHVVWERNGIRAGDTFIPWNQLIGSAYMSRVHLSAAGFYKTPNVYWDRASGRGRPFSYYSYGASVSEVTIDTLTGEYQVDRVDILHDVGRSLNPALDLGQVEGGFIQGMGWLTTEELVWDSKGQLRTHAPSTYKIPLASDIPPIFNVRLADWSVNREMNVGRSKAVGEPPLVLAISVVEALSMAVASVDDYRQPPRLDTPVTPERVLMGVERIRKGRASQ